MGMGCMWRILKRVGPFHADFLLTEVSLTPELNVKVLEASLDWQETLIEEAVEQEDEPLEH